MTKNWTLIIAGFTIGMCSQALLGAQADPIPAKPTTKIEAFSSNKGKLIITDFYRLSSPDAKYGKVEVEALVLHNLSGGASVKGLRIEITEGGRLERSGTSFLDVEELPDLARALGAIQEIATTPQGSEKYSETEFRTNDFTIGFYTSEGKRTAYCASGYIGKVTTFFPNLTYLAAFKKTVEDGIALLANK